MQASIDAIFDLAYRLSIPMGHVFVAGDVFNSWNEPHELVNFVIDCLRRHDHQNKIGPYESDWWLSLIPGNHDLPNHSYSLLNRSALGTLINSGCALNLADSSPFLFALDRKGTKWLSIHAEKYTSAEARGRLYTSQPTYAPVVKLAMTHQYVWSGDYAPFPGVTLESNTTNILKQNPEFHVILSGDNHQQFMESRGKTTLFNPGCLLQRRLDERGMKPEVGILYDDKSVEAYQLTIPIPAKWIDVAVCDDIRAAGFTDPSGFLDALSQAGDAPLKFEDFVKQYLRTQKLRSGVAHRVKLLMEAVRCRP